MRIAGDWLQHPGTQRLCAVLTDAGHLALLVGGCVRNALLGVAVGDVDVATDAPPDRVTALAVAADLRVVPTGVSHGTVTVIAQGRAHEVTTFRRDVQTDGRHAVVAFSTRIEDDAARRDFTMNALYADAMGQVIDPLGGLADLRAGIVRFVGDPAARIAEDYLRILRFFRFHAWYGDPGQGVDAEGLAACARLQEGIDGLSRERIGAEMRKLLAAPDPAPAVAAMAATGVLSRLLPGADPRALGPLVHLEAATPARWLRRLAVLGGAADLLRLSRAEARDLSSLVAAVGAGATPAVLGWHLGRDLGTDALLLRAALLDRPLPADWRDEVARGVGARCPVSAADLMPALSGPALGARLQHLQDRWIASDLRAGRNELLG